ncbi:FAD-dependent oxidoreductase [Methanothrix soehngenii]|jgi:hypothetical protein|nr:NAD(P)-binding protein [Methanothrix soehngenii]MDD5734802.1 NAD(P)-binding protein [Methanothrix soehngenii]
MAAEIKKHVNIPIIAVCNIKEPYVAEQILVEGCCDFVGVARGHLADPEWCNKAQAGKAQTIRICIGCLSCFQEIESQRHVKCAVNPKRGREREFENPKHNGQGRTIVVVGGGPAGIEAALLLDRRGFHVVIFDPAKRLGGTLKAGHRTTIVDMLHEIGQGVPIMVLIDIKRRLSEYGPAICSDIRPCR